MQFSCIRAFPLLIFISPDDPGSHIADGLECGKSIQPEDRSTPGATPDQTKRYKVKWRFLVLFVAPCCDCEADI